MLYEIDEIFNKADKILDEMNDQEIIKLFEFLIIYKRNYIRIRKIQRCYF